MGADCGVDEDYAAFSLAEAAELAIFHDGFGYVEVHGCPEVAGIPESDCAQTAETCQSVGTGQLIQLRDRNGPNVVRIHPGAKAPSNTTLSVGAYSTAP